VRHANDIWGSLAPEYDCTGHRGVFSLHMFYLRASYSWSRSVRSGPGLGFCLDQGSRRAASNGPNLSARLSP